MQRGTRGFLLSRLLIDGPMDLGSHPLMARYLNPPADANGDEVLLVGGEVDCWGLRLTGLGGEDFGRLQFVPLDGIGSVLTLSSASVMLGLDSYTLQGGTRVPANFCMVAAYRGHMHFGVNLSNSLVVDYDADNMASVLTSHMRCTGPLQIGPCSFSLNTADGNDCGGTLRWNPETSKLEVYDGSAWRALAYEVV